MIDTPRDGKTDLTDASIDTKAWIRDKLGRPLEIDDEEAGADWGNNAEAGRALETLTGEPMVKVVTENVYNTENDFNQIFVFSVWLRESDKQADRGEWYYSDEAYVAVNLHHGGDARGNYGATEFYKASDLGENGFLDWVLGWYVVDADTEEPVEEADEFQIGYASNPTYQLEKWLGKGEGEWKDSAYHFTDEDGNSYIAHPEVR